MDVLKNIFLIGCGGFIGSVSRYGIIKGIKKITKSDFPYGTLFVNFLGCLFIGFLYDFLTSNSHSHSNNINNNNNIIINRYKNLAHFVIPGFCGAFTTFSTFSMENIDLVTNQHYLYFVVYLFSTNLLGLVGVVSGQKLANLFILS